MKNKGFILLLCTCALNSAFGGSDDKEYTAEALLGLAYKPLRVVDQVELRGVGEILKSSDEKIASTDVYEISLANTNLTKADQIEKTPFLIKYLRDQPLPRLRTLDLSKCKGVKSFLTDLFDGVGKKFYSLMCIDLSQSDATADDVQLVVNHFKQYDKLVRDMPMYSERNRSNVVQAHVVVDKSLLEQIKDTIILTKEKPFVYYRAGGTQHALTLYQIKVESED